MQWDRTGKHKACTSILHEAKVLLVFNFWDKIGEIKSIKRDKYCISQYFVSILLLRWERWNIVLISIAKLE